MERVSGIDYRPALVAVHQAPTFVCTRTLEGCFWPEASYSVTNLVPASKAYETFLSDSMHVINQVERDGRAHSRKCMLNALQAQPNRNTYHEAKAKPILNITTVDWQAVLSPTTEGRELADWLPLGRSR